MLTIYSKTNCPACVSADSFLTSYGIKHNVIKIDEDESAKQFILARGHRTIPQIYHGDKLFIESGWLGLMKMTKDEINAVLYGK